MNGRAYSVRVEGAKYGASFGSTLGIELVLTALSAIWPRNWNASSCPKTGPSHALASAFLPSGSLRRRSSCL